MSKLTELTIEEALEGLKNKELSAKDLARAHLDAMEEHRDLNSFITETPEIALQQADEADKRIAAGEAKLLDGIPIAVKDLFCTKGVHSQSCSHILDGFKPEYESSVTQKLFDNGGVMLGKTNMDEMAMGSATTNSYYGACKNPWGKKIGVDLVPGGSSGGSAAAVSANLALGALGSDTGGSIRQPAAFCGVTGMKPTYGRCSRWGMIAFASSLDQAGTFGKTVKDNALLLQAIAGHDPKDSTSIPGDIPDFSSMIGQDIKGKKIGIPKEYNAAGMPEEISELWKEGAKMLEKEGAEIVEISLPHTKFALPTYYIIAPAEASSNLARYDGVRYGLRVEGKTLDEMYENTRAEGFGAEVKRRIMIGTYVLSAGYYDAYYKKAQKVRTLIYNDFHSAFANVDAILTPTTPSEAFKIGEKQDDPITMYLNDLFTVAASLAGLPSISLPIGLSKNKLPLGLQLITAPMQEEKLFNIAHVLESAADFKSKID
ncbi:MAG: Asp-tRNA(Asn)/Glu-tRNA(Gln) amidotransferase GatCAB subunit A [Alphaproteobacteria bacterium CG11_big_fil_rev_8_21_14_0_20_44_7]|nr:MAG: Asp-tRNA(Asn)/Glu-tRNA(Gln) amidotransferase GatCAB subunit A [Alphaproteobacteria bacterium CG11_big_fil_rev_8_21_14_0_20_44_7]